MAVGLADPRCFKRYFMQYMIAMRRERKRMAIWRIRMQPFF